MTKRELTSAITFGKRTAEEEGHELAAYFVEADQWRRIFEGQVDIVFGAKGSGKSAIYSLLNSRAGELSKRGITVIPAEDPRGAPVFKDLVADPPASEAEFRGLWKLYFLCLVGAQLRKAALPAGSARQVVAALEQAELLPDVASLRRTLRAVQDYVRAMLRWESVEGGVKLDPTTGVPALTGKITLREPAAAQRKEGFVSVDDLLQLANSALDDAGQSIWLALDRLDVAFADTEELEANALKALFHVYIDLTAYPRISPRVFLRSDIWNRITIGSQREASVRQAILPTRLR